MKEAVGNVTMMKWRPEAGAIETQLVLRPVAVTSVPQCMCGLRPLARCFHLGLSIYQVPVLMKPPPVFAAGAAGAAPPPKLKPPPPVFTAGAPEAPPNLKPPPPPAAAPPKLKAISRPSLWFLFKKGRETFKGRENYTVLYIPVVDLNNALTDEIPLILKHVRFPETYCQKNE